MPNTPSAPNVKERSTDVAGLLSRLRSAELINDKTFAFVTVELDLKTPVSEGTTVLLETALHERAQHGTGGTPADNALLVINTVRMNPALTWRR
jgi:hypothetical protein